MVGWMRTSIITWVVHREENLLPATVGNEGDDSNPLVLISDSISKFVLNFADFTIFDSLFPMKQDFIRFVGFDRISSDLVDDL